MSSSAPIGRPEISNFPLLYIPNFSVGWRELNADDSDVEPAAVMYGSKSRFGTGNTAVIDVIADSDGVVVALYVKQGTDYFLVSSQTTTAAKQQLTFTGLSGRDHFVKVTGATGKNVTLNAGITQ